MLASDRELPVSGGPEKRAYVREMFTAIAPTYDRLNRIISLRFDQRWRRYAVRRLGWERAPEGIYLDLCAGTLDFGATLARQPRIPGSDRRRRLRPARCCSLGRSKSRPARAGDRRRAGPAVSRRHLRRRDGRLGRRGTWSTSTPASAEAARVLKPGARLVILEMTLPPQPRLRAAVPVLLPAGPALDRPTDLETYDRLYLASRVDPGVPAVRPSSRGACTSARGIHAMCVGVRVLHLGRRCDGAARRARRS